MGRALGFISTMVVMAVGMYIYSLQVRSIAAPVGDTGSAGVATIAGVKNDLISIANAERGYQASQGRYASLDELISGNYVTIQRERPPYSYDVQTTSEGFQVTATRNSPGAPAQLWIDQTMRVQSSD